MKWGTQSKPQQGLIDKIKNSQTTLALQQLVNTETRIQIVNDTFDKSIIDHVYTNCAHAIPEVDVQPVGSSDHLGQVVKKFNKFKTEYQPSFRVRNYKRLPELRQRNIDNQVNELIANATYLNEANLIFKREVLYYAN